MTTTISGRSANIIVMDEEGYTPSALTRALACWKQGRGISMVLASELLAEGFDVQALERRHRK